MDFNTKLFIVILIWNVIVFIIYGVDKRKARLRKWRISEKFLILSAVFFGGFGAALGMYIFRHKTKHILFKVAIPFAMVLNIFLIMELVVYFKSVT